MQYTHHPLMPDGKAGESGVKDLPSLTEPPGWSWQGSQQGLEGGAGQVWVPLGSPCAKVPARPSVACACHLGGLASAG